MFCQVPAEMQCVIGSWQAATCYDLSLFRVIAPKG